MQDIKDKQQPQKKQGEPSPIQPIDRASSQSNQKEVKTQDKNHPKVIQEHQAQQNIVQTQKNTAQISKETTKQSKTNKEKQIMEYVTSHKIQLSNEQLKEFVKKQSENDRPFQATRLEQWIKSNNLFEKAQEKQKKEEVNLKKQTTSLKQSKKMEEKGKKQEKSGQALTLQDIQKILQKNGSDETKDFKVQILKSLNKLIDSKIEITEDTLDTYLKSTQNKNVAHFKQWLANHEQKQIETWSIAFKKSIVAKQVQSHLQKLQQIVNLADSTKTNLNINLGAGEGKGKTGLKMGILLRQAQKQKFAVRIQVKIKKKIELRHFIQNQLKKSNKSDEFGVFKMSKIKFEETQKSLKIDIYSKAFEDHVFQDIIAFLEQRFQGEKKPILKAQVQVNIKNSVRQDESTLQNKRFIKWIAEGFTKSLKVQGNSKLAQHFSAPFAEYFPIFKVVKSGDFSLKLKQIQSVDKLFDKLGINEICEQTPTIQKYLQVMIKQHLDPKIVVWAGDLIKYILLFACNIPNQRISIETNISISHLLLYLNVYSDACKQLGDIVSKSTLEQFT